MSKRVLAMALAILAFFIFVGSPFQQSAQAVAIVDDAIIAIIIAALAAIGITFVTDGSFGSLSQYVGDLFNEFAQSQGQTSEQLISGVNTGTNKIGQILVNNRFLVIIDTFALWIKAKFSLSENQTINVVSSNDSIGSLAVYSLPFVIVHNRYNGIDAGDFYYSVITGPEDAYIYFVWNDAGHNGIGVNFVAQQEVSVSVITVNPNGTQSSQSVLLSQDPNNGWFRNRGWTQTLSKNWYQSVQELSIYESAQVENYLQNHVITPGATPIDIVTGTIIPPLSDSDYDEGDGGIIDVGAGWGDAYGDVTDVVIPGDFADGQVPSIDITYEGEAVVQEQVEDSPANTISQEVSDYQIPGLQSVFPFCIPFDIYAFFECLAAEPEAPSFVWRFYIPGICDEDLEIDLAAFDSAARILRTMELLLFIVGLAFVTRDKFLRG